MSVGWNASAISGEYLSAASLMGIAGPLRRFCAYTIPDFAEGRYDSPVFRKIAVCFVLFIGFFHTMPQMKGAGTTLA